MFVFPVLHKIIPESSCGYARVQHFGKDNQRRCRLYVDGAPIMTESAFEQVTNIEVVERAHGRVLIAGLGLGMILWPIAEKSDVTEIVVVEKSADVIALVGPHIPERVEVIHDDIRFWRPAHHGKFNVIWFDIEALNTIAALRQEVRELFRPFLAHLVSRDVDPNRWMNSWQRTALRERRRMRAEKKA